MALIMIAEDEKNMRWTLAKTLEKNGHSVLTFENGAELWHALQDKTPALVILDQKMPVQDGVTTLRMIKESYPTMPVIMITAFSSIENVVEVMKLGAFDYLPKPFNLDQLKIAVDKAVNVSELQSEVTFLRNELQEKYNFHKIIGRSAKMQEVFHAIRQVANTGATVLITGESGTGKELVARAIHYQSDRKNKPFVAVNCAALPESLLESELFGHEKGAFTGSVARRQGRFELADQGTIFLDEIGEMPPSIQAKLLRAIQEREFERVGGVEKIRVDIRIIAATNRDLSAEIRENRFREDLYYRLNVFPISLPPLRERKDDIPLLIDAFLHKTTNDNKQLHEKTIAALVEYDWPGNIRELENIIERLVIICPEKVITPQYLPSEFKRPALTKHEGEHRFVLPASGISLDEVEKDFIKQALEQAKGNQTKAAELLGITRHTLMYRMQKYDLT